MDLSNLYIEQTIRAWAAEQVIANADITFDDSDSAEDKPAIDLVIDAAEKLATWVQSGARPPATGGTVPPDMPLVLKPLDTGVGNPGILQTT